MVGLLGGYQRSIQELQVGGPRALGLVAGPWGGVGGLGWSPKLQACKKAAAGAPPLHALSSHRGTASSSAGRCHALLPPRSAPTVPSRQDKHSVLVVRLRGENTALKAEVGAGRLFGPATQGSGAVAAPKALLFIPLYAAWPARLPLDSVQQGPSWPSAPASSPTPAPCLPPPCRRRTSCARRMPTPTPSSARCTATSEPGPPLLLVLVCGCRCNASQRGGGLRCWHL